MTEETKGEMFTPHVTADTNFKEYFLKHDALNNLTDQLIFSLYEKYRCYAGCKMCYLNPFWMTKEEMGSHTPTITPEREAAILEMFEWFSIASTHDDLYTMKRDDPVMFDFYVRNSNKMWYAGMTDISFIQQQPIIQQLSFKGVYEVTFSEEFICKNDGKIVSTIKTRLGELLKNTALSKMKVIISTTTGEDNEHVKDLIDFAHTYSLPVGVHYDFSTLPTTRDAQSADYVEGYQVVDATPIMILSESVHAQCGHLYMTLAEATKKDGIPYHDIFTNAVVRSVVLSTLKAKVETYRRNAKILTLAPNKPMRDYCAWVSSNIIINDDFNFIPNMVIGPWTNIYKKLMSEGFVHTQYGLLQQNATTIIPLFSFR